MFAIFLIKITIHDLNFDFKIMLKLKLYLKFTVCLNYYIYYYDLIIVDWVILSFIKILRFILNMGGGMTSSCTKSETKFQGFDETKLENRKIS